MDVNYITGEHLQELTDHTIIVKGQSLVEEQLKHTNCKYTYFDRSEIINSLPSEIQNAKSLFVYTHELDFFFEKIYPLLTNRFVLMTHNSDICITPKFIKYLNDNKIKKWLAQNVYCVHENLIPIPIGLANSQWPHGNLEIFDKIRKENNKKETAVYKNFDVNTSHCNRAHVMRDTPHIPTAPRKSFEEYWRDISKSIFCLCPMGSGVDTHRMWECLYLNTIPIVAECINNNGFKELPMISIPEGQFKNWNIINQSFLEEQYNKIKATQYNLEKLSLDYWRNLINEFCNL